MINVASKNASEHGFESQFWSAWQAEGSPIASGAVRMLHEGRKCFLQIVASGNGTLGMAETHIVSFGGDGRKDDCSFTTSNAHKKYTLPAFANANYIRGATIGGLLQQHNIEYQSQFADFKSIESFDDIAFVVDSVSFRFANYMVDRGLWVRR